MNSYIILGVVIVVLVVIYFVLKNRSGKSSANSDSTMPELNTAPPQQTAPDMGGMEMGSKADAMAPEVSTDSMPASGSAPENSGQNMPR